MSGADSLGGTVASTYDSDNYLTKRTYQGQTQTMRMDFTNNKEGWNTTLTRYSDLAGTTLVATTSNGFDGAGNITSVLSTDSGSNTIDKFTYSFDSGGNVTQVVETQNSVATTISYTYDADNQLTNDGTAYGYDSNGNRNTGSYTVGTGNQMSKDANWTYTYNKEGDLTQKSTTALNAESWTYAYSADNKLTEVKHYDTLGTLALTVDYKYDAFGELIKKDDGTVVTKYGVDGWNTNMPTPIGKENFNDWAILNNDGTLQTRNLFGNRPSQILGRVDQTGASDPSGVYYDLTDRLGSVRDVINSSGTVKDRLADDGFGNIKAGELDSTYRGWYSWTGRQLDTETNLQYNNARWYDPKMGRWIGRDPLGFDAGDSNLYRYVKNAPTGAVDPSGLLGEAWTFGRLAEPVFDITYNGKNLGKMEFYIGKKGKQQALLAKFNVDQKYKDIYAAAKAVNTADHFNWYQVVTKDAEAPTKKNKGGKVVQPQVPYIDPPSGGFFDGKKGEIDTWADSFPWMYNEVSPPAGTKGFNKKSVVSQNVIEDGRAFLYVDTPSGTTNTLAFDVWLVAVGKAEDGAKLKGFVVGFSYEIRFKDGASFIEAQPKRLNNPPSMKEFVEQLRRDEFDAGPYK